MDSLLGFLEVREKVTLEGLNFAKIALLLKVKVKVWIRVKIKMISLLCMNSGPGIRGPLFMHSLTRFLKVKEELTLKGLNFAKIGLLLKVKVKKVVFPLCMHLGPAIRCLLYTSDAADE